MTTADQAMKILDSMLSHMGIAATIELEETNEGPCLQIHSADSKLLIGRDGDRLDDLQYLVNRIINKQFPSAERFKVDCDHFRNMREDKLAEEVREVAERVKQTGEPYQFRPLNAYYRRLVYQELLSMPELQAHSPETDERLKRITISVKNS